mmetsp:Transcript_28214/g.50936  ORF Transcript_28214/g.50936 Transcript_28214/m.50936 type:complete len:164 (-) Transcript_28214:23-514(-)
MMGCRLKSLICCLIILGAAGARQEAFPFSRSGCPLLTECVAVKMKVATYTCNKSSRDPDHDAEYNCPLYNRSEWMCIPGEADSTYDWAGKGSPREAGEGADRCCKFCPSNFFPGLPRIEPHRLKFQTVCRTAVEIKMSRCDDPFFEHGECYEPAEDNKPCDLA